MGWPRHNGPDDLDCVLDALRDPYLVRPLGSARFVLGPSGAHVISVDDATSSAPRVLAHLATVARAALAEQTAWVPFIDALLVTGRLAPCPPATRVPPEMIASSLVNGPPVLAPADLARLTSCVEGGALDRVAAEAPGLAGEPLPAP